MDRLLSDIEQNDFSYFVYGYELHKLRHWKFDNTVMGLKNHVAGSFASSPTHRCLNAECAERLF